MNLYAPSILSRDNRPFLGKWAFMHSRRDLLSSSSSLITMPQMSTQIAFPEKRRKKVKYNLGGRPFLVFFHQYFAPRNKTARKTSECVALMPALPFIPPSFSFFLFWETALFKKPNCSSGFGANECAASEFIATRSFVLFRELRRETLIS